MIATSVAPAVVERRADRADLAVHHPARRDDVCARVRLRARRSARSSSSVASLSTSPRSFSTPQCPWSVYSSRQRSVDHDGVVAEVVAERADRLLGDAVRVPRLGALGVLVLGHPEEHEREHAASTGCRPRLCAATRPCAGTDRASTRSAPRRGCPPSRTAARSGRRARAWSRARARGAPACGAGGAVDRRGRPSPKGSGPAGPPAQTRVITTTGIVRFAFFS